MQVRPLHWVFTLLLVTLPSAFAQQSASIASQVALLNRSLETRAQLSRPSRGAVSPDQLSVLQVRQKLVEQLMRTDPGLVRSVMLPASVAAALSSSSPEYAAAIEADVNWSGTLEGAIADDFEHGTSSTHWYLQSGGRQIELFFVGNQHPMQRLHRAVTVRGVATPRVMSVDGLHADITAAANPPGLNCGPIGVENTAVLVMNQPSGGATYPNGLGSTSFWTQNYFGNSAPSTNNYWQEASFGLTSGTGMLYSSGTQGSLTFSQTEDCTNPNQLASDAVTAAIAGGVDFSNYSRISIVYPVSSCSFGGLGTIGCYAAGSQPATQISHPYSITWIPVQAYYPANQVLWGVVAHELGHNLGLNHSSSLQFGAIPLGAIDYVDNYPNGSTSSSGTGLRTEYGDPYTIMGDGSYNCFGQYTAFNKAEYLTWMNRTADVNEITSIGGSFQILPFENSSGLRALRILRDPLTSSWVWMEYRQALGNYDNDFGTCLGTTNVLSGANVYYESPYSQDGHLFLLDMNVSNSTAFDIHNGALTPGTSWSDPYSLLTLSVSSADSTGITVTAGYDQPCATLSAPGVFPAAGGIGSIAITVTSTPCQWTANTVDSWITNVSPASGTSSGTVTFSVADNSASTSQRNGYITVQRQSVPVAQQGTHTFVSNLSPTLQSGISGVPVFTFNDPAGTADINYVTMKVHDSDCEIEITQSSGTWFMFLLDPATNNFSSSLIPGTSGSASNANCSLNAATSTVSTTGNQVQFGLGLTFASSFAGSYRVTASACDGTNGSTCTSDLSLGTWQVPGVATISGLSVSSGKQGASVPVAITGTNTHFSGLSAVTVSGGGVAASAVSAASSTQLSTTLTISPSAASSVRTLTVTTGTEVVTTSFTVAASGQVQFSSPSLTFGNQNPFTTSSTQQVMLTNNGQTTLNISNISASSEFGVTNNCPSALAVNANCTLNITFQPNFVGTRSGSVSIVDDAPNSPQSVALSGFGNAVIPISRPSRSTFTPFAISRPGIVSHAIFALGDFGVTSASDLVCQGTRRLTCSVEASEQPGEVRLVIDASHARPGRYVVHVSAPDQSTVEALAIPVIVKSPRRFDRPSK